MKVALLGATGYVGSALLPALFSVISVVNSSLDWSQF